MISEEIESSDVFVLILGERYGWIPAEGPQSDLGVSVTHLEYKEALHRDLPILPFLKKLSYDTDRDSDDAKKRDAFRKEVTEWSKGHFVTDFELAIDLAESVGHSLIALLTDKFLIRKMRERATLAGQALRSFEERHRETVSEPAVEIPERLAAAVAKREAVLFAGAGISMAAGLPSAAAFADHLSQVLYKKDPGYVVSPSGAAFAAIASDLEASMSREFLLQEVGKLLDPPQGLQPTVAHTKAVGLFDLIFTTNWDSLFEEAAAAQGKPLSVISEEIPLYLPDRALIKLHGSLSNPGSLLLTESDVLSMDKNRARLWAAARNMLRDRTLVVVGTSLRDPSIFRLFDEAQPRSPGYFVVPKFFAATAARLRAWNLQCIDADADSFFTKLADAVSRIDST